VRARELRIDVLEVEGDRRLQRSCFDRHLRNVVERVVRPALIEAKRVQPLLPVHCVVTVATLQEEYELDRMRTRETFSFSGQRTPSPLDATPREAATANAHRFPGTPRSG
jgi:hypothetical protein